MNCSQAITSTLLQLCFVADPPIPSGYLVLTDSIPTCIVKRSTDCSEVPCFYLGGIIDACGRGISRFYDVRENPLPNECFYVSFEDI